MLHRLDVLVALAIAWLAFVALLALAAPATALNHVQLLSVSNEFGVIELATDADIAYLSRNDRTVVFSGHELFGTGYGLGVMDFTGVNGPNNHYRTYYQRVCYGLCAGPPTWTTCTPWLEATAGAPANRVSLEFPSAGTWCVRAEVSENLLFSNPPDVYVSDDDGGPSGSCAITVP